LKKILLIFIFNLFIFTQSSSEEMEIIEYGNTKLGVASHSLQLAEETKATPIYAKLKYKLSDSATVVPYLKGDMGYNYIQDDVTGGTGISNMTDSKYYSLGAGVDIKNNLSLEVAYENYQITPDDEDADGRMVLKFDYKY
jgi:hypothetical protein